MDDASFDEYRKQRYEDQVNWFDEKAKRNQALSRFWQSAQIATSALTPIILVSHFLEHSPVLAALAVASAAANLVITGVMKTFQFDEHWHRYRNVCEDMRAEIHLYCASAHEYRDAQDRRAMFVQRVEEMISRERQDWHKTSSHREPIAAGH